MTLTSVKPAVDSAQHFQPVNAFKHASLNLFSLPKLMLCLHCETPHIPHDQSQPFSLTDDPKTPTQYSASRRLPSTSQPSTLTPHLTSAMISSSTSTAVTTSTEDLSTSAAHILK